MIHLKLVSLTGIKYDDDVYEVILPTLEGQIGILGQHMPLVAVLTNGIIIVRHRDHDNDSNLEYLATNGGAIEVKDNILKIIADEADRPDEINKEESKAAIERAEKLKSETTDAISLEDAQSLIDRHNVRLQVANIRRHHHQHRDQ